MSDAPATQFNPFAKAVKESLKARAALCGPTGSGKTWDALVAAEVLAGEGGRVALIDTENRSALYYADRFSFEHMTWEPPYDPAKLRDMIRFADGRGALPGQPLHTRIDRPFDVIVIDSLTHFWKGEGGTIDVADDAAKRYGGNSFAGWKEATPILRALLDSIIFSPAHVLVTMRSKMEYIQERDDKGKSTVRKIGLAPEMRADIEYEFTVVLDIALPSHEVVVSKSRCDVIAGRVAPKERVAELFTDFRDWLGSGVQMPTRDELEAIQTAFAVGWPEKGERAAVKRLMVEKFGHLEHVTADEYPAVLAWVNDQALADLVVEPFDVPDAPVELPPRVEPETVPFEPKVADPKAHVVELMESLEDAVAQAKANRAAKPHLTGTERKQRDRVADDLREGR